jgi:hypothetical protein
MFVTLRGRCVEVEALADPQAAGDLGLGTFGTIGGGGGYGGAATPRLFAVAAGAVVRWPDGGVAGRTREAARLYQPSATGEGLCSHFTAGDGSTDVVLCFAEDDARLLALGRASADDLRVRSSPADSQEEPRHVEQRIGALVRGLRAPCVSHAIEADPALDVRMKVRMVFSQSSPPKVTLTPKSGSPSEPLRGCVLEQLGAFRPFDLDGVTLDFELHMAMVPARAK